MVIMCSPESGCWENDSRGIGLLAESSHDHDFADDGLGAKCGVLDGLVGLLEKR